MSAHWCKVAPNLDSHPKIRKAGRLGREIFLFALRRNAEPGNRVPGRISADELDPDYLCDMLFVTSDEAVTGVTLAVTAGLLVRDGADYVIVAWKDGCGKSDSRGAARTAKWRENKKMPEQASPVTSRDVTRDSVRHGDEDKTRLDKTIISAPSQKRGARKQPARPMPPDWTPSQQAEDRAKSDGLDCQAEAQRFADHHAAKGSVFADWDAAFRTWLNNAVKFRDERGGGKSSAPQQSFRRIEEL